MLAPWSKGSHGDAPLKLLWSWRPSMSNNDSSGKRLYAPAVQWLYTFTYSSSTACNQGADNNAIFKHDGGSV